MLSLVAVVAEHTVDVRIRPRLDAVTVRPGDKLVVRVKPNFTMQDMDER